MFNKKRREDKEWFNGLKWAESEVQNCGAITGQANVEMATFGEGSPFDTGAKDYLTSYACKMQHEDKMIYANPAFLTSKAYERIQQLGQAIRDSEDSTKTVQRERWIDKADEIFISNSIIAANTNNSGVSLDCSGDGISSSGYNIIGSNNG